jgi:hypothetical protein
MHDFALKAEHLARALGERQLLYIALCQRLASSLVPSADAHAPLAEIVALESEAWPPRYRAQRCLAAFVVHNLEGRRREALRAAEAGLIWASEAGSTLLSALFGNWTVVALLDLGDIERATDRIGQLRQRLMAGPADIVIPFIGTCARCSLAQGDLSGARNLLGQMFDLCRAVEWSSFEFFAVLYVRLALAERRLHDAARLLGFADAARKRAWSRARPVRSLKEARSALSAALGTDRVACLCAEGRHLGHEQVCSLALRNGAPTRTQVA